MGKFCISSVTENHVVKSVRWNHFLLENAFNSR